MKNLPIDSLISPGCYSEMAAELTQETARPLTADENTHLEKSTGRPDAFSHKTIGNSGNGRDSTLLNRTARDHATGMHATGKGSKQSYSNLRNSDRSLSSAHYSQDGPTAKGEYTKLKYQEGVPPLSLVEVGGDSIDTLLDNTPEAIQTLFISDETREAYDDFLAAQNKEIMETLEQPRPSRYYKDELPQIDYEQATREKRSASKERYFGSDRR